jgi:iron complex transport system substrate-binding protein
VAADPDIILTNVDYVENPTEEIKSRAGWENMKAVKNNDVYYIDKSASSLSNHNVVKALKEMAEAVYPEVFKK